MRFKNFFYFFILLLSVNLLVSCDDDDEEETAPEPTKTEQLVDGDWVGDKVFINRINLADYPGIGSNAQTFQSLRIDFADDKTYVATFNNDGQEERVEGTWELNEDETMLTMGGFGELKVDDLTNDKLNVSTTINTSNAAAIARIFGVDPALIIGFLNGASLNTEMRFVKAN